MKFYMNIDGEIKDVVSLVWMDNGTKLRAFPEGEGTSYVIIKGDGEDTDVNATLHPLHNIDNIDYKKKVLQRELYHQMNTNADIVAENVSLSNAVNSHKKFIEYLDSQLHILENDIHYWNKKYDNLRKIYFVTCCVIILLNLFSIIYTWMI